MKHELYYTTGSPEPTYTSAFSVFRNIKTVLLLILALLGGFLYFNTNFITKLMNFNPLNKIVTYEKPITENQKIAIKDKFTQEELQTIANKIVESLKVIKLEKKPIQKAYKVENKILEKVKVKNEPKITTTTYKPIYTPSFSSQITQNEIPSKEEEFYSDVSYYQEEVQEIVEEIFPEINELEVVEEFSNNQIIEYSPTLEKDKLEVLSIELNHVVGNPSYNYQENVEEVIY